MKWRYQAAPKSSAVGRDMALLPCAGATVKPIVSRCFDDPSGRETVGGIKASYVVLGKERWAKTR